MRFWLIIWINIILLPLKAQVIKGKIMYAGKSVSGAIILIGKSNKKIISDTTGYFEFQTKGQNIFFTIYYPGFLPYVEKLQLIKDTFIFVHLQPDTTALPEVSIESVKPILNKKPDAFNTEIYDACIITSAAATSLFEGVQNINGLRPQLNCNICNTGDIHINGMEGAYTNILIDGMPVIGGIASIYGLSGISSDIIEKIEITRYPGSVLYGSDNIGGTINIITKKPTLQTSSLGLQAYTSSYMDHNVDLSWTKKIKKYSGLNAVNIVWFDKIFDSNSDGFTDATLQKRATLFHKSIFNINDSIDVQWMIRGLVEDRWGGQVNWSKQFRGTDSIYGESILTKRLESIFKIPLYLANHKLENNLSYNYHYQNSYYGTLFFEAQQHNLYYQTYASFTSRVGQHLNGIAFKYFYYTDNTAIFKNTTPFNIWMVPAIYSENNIRLNKNIKSILSIRYDYHNIHKHIITPRLAILYSNEKGIEIRTGITTGFRPVQLFTEDHAALTGARKIVIQEKLLPEKSYVAYCNVSAFLINQNHLKISSDFNMWYIYFTNRIVPDYSLSDKIIYYNLGKQDYSVNQGISAQFQILFKNYIQSLLGFSWLDNYIYYHQEKRRLFLSEPWSANFVIRGFLKKWTLEYTGNIYGSMQLPLAGALDPRPDKSPVYSIQNLQIKFQFSKIEITTGIKNILDFTPDKNIPFLIARSHDPFDKNVVFDSSGNPLPTSENPYALTFDPTYTYASMQKRRWFIGFSIRF
ncbi:MAG: TonB-dependent receptor plug domain-containing protein [Bacteroidota bacterium]